MRRAILAGVTALATAGLLALVWNPASADVETAVSKVNLKCVFVVTSDITPGITPTPTLNIFDSHGLTGTATCTGTINKKKVTGPGTFGIKAKEIASCTQLGGTGEFKLRVPTLAGYQIVRGTYTSGGGITGDMQGTAQVVSVDIGDCFNTPATRVTTRIDVHVGPPVS